MKFLAELFLLGALVGNEFMQRRIDQADGDRESVHGFEDADEVATLERKQLVQRLDASLPIVRQDHLLNGTLALVTLFGMLEIGEEHVLGAAQPDALGTEFASFARILRRVRIGADAQATDAIGPLHQYFVRLGQGRHNQWHRAFVDHAFTAVESDPLAFFNGLAACRHFLRRVVDFQFLRANDATLAPATGHHGGVTGLAARGGEDALRDRHATDIFGAGLATHQNNFLTFGGPSFGFVGGENYFTDCGAGNSVDAGGDDFGD